MRLTRDDRTRLPSLYRAQASFHSSTLSLPPAAPPLPFYRYAVCTITYSSLQAISSRHDQDKDFVVNFVLENYCHNSTRVR